MLFRFTGVFNLTYTRFLDLQKAEKQARESQIQLALERVRARTMAMQNSNELADAAILLFNQVKDLGIKTWTTGFNVWQDDSSSYTDWITTPEGNFVEPYVVDTTRFSVFNDVANARKKGDDFFVSDIEGEIIEKTYQYLSSFGEKQFAGMREDGFEFPKRQINHFVFGSQVSLLFITYEPCPENWELFKRFGKVFEQTYTRFLDLQRAETQAREATIETSLERIRSKTMAMHNSEDVGHTVAAMFEELIKLGIDQSIRCGIAIIREKTFMEIWTASTKDNGEIDMNIGSLDMSIHPVTIGLFDAWNRKETGYSYFLQDEDLKNYYRAVNEWAGYNAKFDIDQLPKTQYHNSFLFTEGALYAFSPEALSKEHAGILKRFAGVFGLTYRRFIDLQKAEAQARESTIEAALERVRGKAMAMRDSNDLSSATSMVFTELRKLNIQPIRSGVGFLTKGFPESAIVFSRIRKRWRKHGPWLAGCNYRDIWFSWI